MANRELHDSWHTRVNALKGPPMTTECSYNTGDVSLSIESLSAIPGVGEKVKKALTDHFGSEAVALKVILDSRVDLVATVPGIGSRQAVNIVKGAFETEFGVSANMILRSADMRKIFDQVLGIIRGYAKTSYGKDKLLLYFPLPPEKIDVIRERQEYFADAAEIARDLTQESTDSLGALLSDVRGLYRRVKPRRLEGRVVITNDDKVFDALINERVDRWCPVYVLSEGESGADYAKGYDLVLFISPFGLLDNSLDMFDNVEMLGKDWTVDKLLPERTVSFYSRNYKVIGAACKLAETFNTLPDNESMKTFRDSLDFENLSKVSTILENLQEDGGITEGMDLELDRFRKAVKIFPTAVAEIESWLNEEIRTRITKSEIKLGGQQIINILQSADMEGAEGSALRNMLPAEIIETFTASVQDAEDRLVQMLGLSAKEADWATGVVSEEIALPVKMVPTQINALEDRLRRIYADKQFVIIKKIASQLDELKEIVTKAVQTLLEFDLFLAVGLFARDYDLQTPDLSLDYEGVGIQGASNVFLVESMLKGKHGKVQPIDYAIGKTPFQPDGTHGENCVILSGANSGGKTTTIQTLAQIVAMAQTGFPVPAREANIRVFEELYFFYKSRGVVNAGAFETTLKQFADIVVSTKSKLVLFDEIEAITEPGSAANVIAGLVEILQSDPKSCTVICSHMAKEVRESTNVPMRIDGIEARGLDENLELIVDRTPRFGHLARSTPELIVERLTKKAKGKKQEVYSKILENLTRDRSN